MTDRANTITATITRFYDEKFRTLDAQTSKAAVDVKTAMDAAFVAAAAAASKQETAFTKQIDQLTANVQLIAKASDDKLTDLKDRIVAMEGRSSVSDPTTAATLRDMGSVISSLKASNDQNVGGRQQKADITTWIFSAIAAASALAFLVIDIFKPSH